MRARWTKAQGLDILGAHLIDYPSPTNLGYLWGIGSTAGLCLGIQIVTGIFLAMHYTPHVDLAFASVEHIMRDVNNGWLLRYLHANGASMFLSLYMYIWQRIFIMVLILTQESTYGVQVLLYIFL